MEKGIEKGMEKGIEKTKAKEKKKKRKKDKTRTQCKLALKLINHCRIKDYAELSTGWVARKLGLSRCYLSRAFKATYGCTLSAYIKKAKIEMAYKLVTRTNLSIEKITKILDYSSPSYFIKVFRNNKMLPPQTARYNVMVGGELNLLQQNETEDGIPFPLP